MVEYHPFFLAFNLFSHFFFFIVFLLSLPSQITLTCSLFSLFVVSSVLPACLPVVVCRVYILCCCRRSLSLFFLLLFIFMWCVRKRKKWKIKCGKMIISLSLSPARYVQLFFSPLSALISLTLVTDCPHSFISFVLFLLGRKKMVCLHGIY